jgi:N-dimethylarginine dimethylaminohydrolase
MTWAVHQHWDPLTTCIVGRSYPPEFYSWITVPHVRNLFEKISQETEEDYQCIIRKLQEFGVEILRPDVMQRAPTVELTKPNPPPMNPRDWMVMIGSTFHDTIPSNFKKAYNEVKDASWEECSNWKEFDQLPDRIQQECIEIFNFDQLRQLDHRICYEPILDRIAKEGNKITPSLHYINGASVSRLGRDLFFGTENYSDDIHTMKQQVQQMFPDYRTHVINTGGHADGTFCPVAPGLIISLHNAPTYKNEFPDWEVVYLPGESWHKIKPFLDLKHRNHGKWWIPGFEYDQSVINVVETWLTDWVGYVEETVFDVNMLIVDPKNVLVFNYNKTVFRALEQRGITPHVVPFRHRYFWDGGIHCITNDLNRVGTRQDFFL